jgi:hypothetical protein
LSLSFIDEVIARYDNMEGPFELFEVGQAILTAGNGQELTPKDQHLLRSEVAALRFGTRKEDGSEWGTHFAPWYTATGEDGSTIRDPDLASLNEESIKVWSERAVTACHPILKARYADVVWDLQRKISSDGTRSFTFGQLAADAYMDAARENRFRWGIESAFALQRALSISLQLGDAGRTRRIVDAMIAMAQSVGLDKPGFWVVPFDSAFGKQNVSPQQSAEIISQLEARLTEAVAAKDGWRAQLAAERLLNAYRKTGDRDSALRVVRAWGATFLAMAEGASAILAVGWLQPIIQLYQNEGLRDDAERLRVYVEKRGRTVNDEMHQGELTIPFDRKEVEDYLNRIIDVNDPCLALFRLANTLLPDPQNVRQEVHKAAEQFISYSLFPVEIVGPHGLPIARVGTYEEDAEGRLVHDLARHLGLMPSFFIRGYEKIKEKFSLTNEVLMDGLFSSLLFKADRRTFFAEGFAAYEAGDYLKAVHVLVPQMEGVLRNLLEIMGIPVTKTIDGMAELKNMNDVLHDERVRDDLEEKWWMFLKTLYTDKRGFNLRNDLAHGIAPIEVFNIGTAAIVIQSIVLLWVIRPGAVNLDFTEPQAL